MLAHVARAPPADARDTPDEFRSPARPLQPDTARLAHSNQRDASRRRRRSRCAHHRFACRLCWRLSHITMRQESPLAPPLDAICARHMRRRYTSRIAVSLSYELQACLYAQLGRLFIDARRRRDAAHTTRYCRALLLISFQRRRFVTFLGLLSGDELFSRYAFT